MSLLVIDFHNELVQLVVGSNSMTAHAGHTGCAQYKFYNQVLSKGRSTAYGTERERATCQLKSFRLFAEFGLSKWTKQINLRSKIFYQLPVSSYPS